MLKQALSNLIVSMMISQNCMHKLHKRGSVLQWILGRFGFPQNKVWSNIKTSENRNAKKSRIS